jgi:hypothetical protein
VFDLDDRNPYALRRHVGQYSTFVHHSSDEHTNVNLLASQQKPDIPGKMFQKASKREPDMLAQSNKRAEYLVGEPIRSQAALPRKSLVMQADQTKSMIYIQKLIGSSRGSSIGSGSVIQNFITEECETSSILA